MEKAKKEAEQRVFRPGEDIVAPTVDGLRKKLLNLMEGGGKELVVDLTGVQMIDSVGIGLLVATHNSLHKTGGRLVVTNASKDICDLFKAMRLDQHFELRMSE